MTPTSHAFSGGNVVFGTSPGRAGQVLKTPAGDIPVFNNVREGLDAGHAFNTGVVYLPPSGVRDGVAELIRVNAGLRKIVIITEKIAVHDAREIRAMAQANGIDIIGGNCLGVADSLEPGAHRRRARRRPPGGVAAQGLGRDLLELRRLHHDDRPVSRRPPAGARRRSSPRGKDVYIHYAARDFAHAFADDDRSKAAVLYAEPGGYYEHGIDWKKPVVACVVGRWKSKLTRAVGHAGAMAGSGDRAEDKERWFMEAFGVDGIFTPENPVVSAKGAVVTNIADIPAALTAVMALNGVAPDFAPRGNLALKPWIANDQGLRLPPELALPRGDGARALRGADRGARQPGRRGGRAAEHEGQVRRLGHGPEDPGDERARPLGARPGARSRWRRTSRCRWCTRSPARTTGRCSTSRWRPRSTSSATRSSSPPTRRATPATRRTR